MPETTKARVNLEATQIKISTLKIQLYTNNNASPDEHAQWQNELERLKKVRFFQEELIKRLQDRDPFVQTKRIYDARDNAWYERNATKLAETQTTVVYEVEPDEDDEILSQITGTSTAVQIQLQPGKKRKITLMRTASK